MSKREVEDLVRKEIDSSLSRFRNEMHDYIDRRIHEVVNKKVSDIVDKKITADRIRHEDEKSKQLALVVQNTTKEVISQLEKDVLPPITRKLDYLMFQELSPDEMINTYRNGLQNTYTKGAPPANRAITASGGGTNPSAPPAKAQFFFKEDSDDDS